MAYDTNGMIVIDKPPGITSAGVVAVVKRALGVKKVGHAGTLDPFATGILVCLINKATRLARFLVDGNKTYEAELLLGVETDTEDLTGRVLCRQPVGNLTADAVHREAARWVGSISQQPPVYSALKHRGRPLYEMARAGRPVQKPPRDVTISALAVTAVDLPRIRFQVTCSPGTYIRTLGADIGRALGCGGHLTALRRTASSGFTIDDAVPLAAFRQAADQGDGGRCVLPMATAMQNTPSVVADTAMYEAIRHGRPIAKAAAGSATVGGGGPVRVLTSDDRLVAILMDAGDAAHFAYGCVLIG